MFTDDTPLLMRSGPQGVIRKCDLEELLVFGGTFRNLKGNIAYFAHKKHNSFEKLASLAGDNIIFNCSP